MHRKVFGEIGGVKIPRISEDNHLDFFCRVRSSTPAEGAPLEELKAYEEKVYKHNISLGSTALGSVMVGDVRLKPDQRKDSCEAIPHCRRQTVEEILT